MIGTAALEELFDAGLWELDPALELLGLVCQGDRAAAELRETLVVHGERRSFVIGAFFELEHGLICRGTVYREGSADIT